MIKKLRRKFVLAAMLSLFIVLAVLIFVINILNYRSLVREADDTLDTLSELDGNAPNHFTFGRKDGSEPSGGKTPGTRHDYSGERPYQSRYFSVLLSGDGEIAEVDLRNVVTVDEKTALSMATDAANASRRRGFSNDYRYLGVPTDDGMRWIFLNREVELDTARDFLLTSCLISLAGFATVFLLLLLISGRVVQPIAQSYEKQKQFITDAGHELKTPIAIIRANTEAMEMISGQNKWSRNISAQVTRLSELTRNLLTLARAEEVPQAGSLSELDFSALTQQTAQTFQEPMALRGITLDAEIEPDLRLRGSRDQLSTLLSILFDNAVKYAAEGSTVTLRLTRADKMLRLRMENDCETLPDCPPERLFDRFYRADSARTQKSGGFGIGLSAAQVITLRHRGRLEAEYPADRRIAFTVFLPAL